MNVVLNYCFAVVCYTAIDSWSKHQSNGLQVSLLFPSTHLLNEWVFPNPVSQSLYDSSMISALEIFHHHGKRKAFQKTSKNSWNLLFFIRAIILLIVWTRDQGTMWLPRYEMILHKLAISFTIHEYLSILWRLLCIWVL